MKHCLAKVDCEAFNISVIVSNRYIYPYLVHTDKRRITMKSNITSRVISKVALRTVAPIC